MREGWEYKKLGDVGMIVTGTTPSTKDETNYNPQEYNFVKPSDLQSNGITKIDKTEFYVSSKGLILSRSLPLGSVLVSCIGSIGKVGILTKKACCNQQINAIIPNEYMDSRCLAYSILSMKYKLEAIANAPVVPIINKTNFSKLVVPVPSKREQLAIVAELDQINDLIRLKKEQLKEYDNLAQSIFYDMFGDPVENEKGWEVRKLDDMYNVSSSKRIYQSELVSYGVPFLKVSDIVNLIDSGDAVPKFFIEENKYDNLKARKIVPQKGDLLITARGTLGKCYIVKSTDRFYFQDGMVTWLSNKTHSLNSIFVAFIFKQRTFYEYLYKNARHTTIDYISIQQLARMQVPLPPLPLQQEFSSRIEQIEKLKTEVQKTITDLETLLASRMQYWFG